MGPKLPNGIPVGIYPSRIKNFCKVVTSAPSDPLDMSVLINTGGVETVTTEDELREPPELDEVFWLDDEGVEAEEEGPDEDGPEEEGGAGGGGADCV